MPITIDLTKYSKFIALSAFLITITIWTGISDPVNNPKFLLLGIFTIPIGSIGVWIILKEKNKANLKFLFAIFLFVIASLYVSILSSAPFSQNFYGVYGRNTGFLTYFGLALLAIGSSVIRDKSQIEKIFFGLFAAGGLNLAYCLYVILFGDFIPWNNPYKTILGTFGNPNFISSFLGIFASIILAYLIQVRTPKKAIGVSFIYVLAIYEIYKSRSIQGIVVVCLGAIIVGFYWLKTSNISRLVFRIYVFVSLAISIIGILGTQKIGPLAGYLFKPSVLFREQYWYAGLQMGRSNIFSGIGMDSYGDWYRRSRGEEALIHPGINVTSNAAHSVPIDIFAYGGLPLVVLYLLIIFFACIKIYRLTSCMTTYKPVPVALVVGFLCYQVQSLISINQIGLAIWGWLFTGLLAGYPISGVSEGAKKKSEPIFYSSTLIVGMTVGFILFYPPISADIKWTAALRENNLQKLEDSVNGDYWTPVNSARLAQATLILQNSNFELKSIEMAKRGVKFNPENSDAWKLILTSKLSSKIEKNEALKNLRRIDPYNPDWKLNE